jgi:hypothetical protein
MEGLDLFIKKKSGNNNYIKIYTIFSVDCGWRFKQGGKILISSIHYYGDEFETEELKLLQDIKKQNLSIISIEEKKNRDYTIILSNDSSIDFFYIECLSGEKYAINMKDEKGNIVTDIKTIIKLLEL